MVDEEGSRVIYGAVIPSSELFTPDGDMARMRKIARDRGLHVALCRNSDEGCMETYVGRIVNAEYGADGQVSVSHKELVTLALDTTSLIQAIESCGVNEDLCGDLYPPKIGLYFLPDGVEAE